MSRDTQLITDKRRKRWNTREGNTREAQYEETELMSGSKSSSCLLRCVVFAFFNGCNSSFIQSLEDKQYKLLSALQVGSLLCLMMPSVGLSSSC